jgi:hypothetical protein
MKRSQGSWREQSWRRRAAALLRQDGLLRGSVSIRRRVCGKPGCRCARGERHEAMYVVYRQAGRTVQLYVPHAWEERVRRWVERYGEARELLDKLSGLYEARVRKRRE